MQVETMLSDQIARFLDLATAEAKLTAANMANIDTPGYRTVGMDFEAEMREAMSDVAGNRGPKRVRVMGVDGLISRPDGNNVDGSRGPESCGGTTQIQDRSGVAARRISARDGRNSL
jgi:flagellar basal-body rod protein FlgB